MAVKKTSRPDDLRSRVRRFQHAASNPPAQPKEERNNDERIQGHELGFRVGKWLRRYRERVGLTQREVAAAAGVTSQCISQLENDRRAASGAILMRVLAALDVHSLGEFFFEMERQEDPVCRKSERKEMTGPEELASLQFIGPRHNSFDFFLVHVELRPGYVGPIQTLDSDEGYFVLTGKVSVSLDSEVHIVPQGDACFVPSGCPRQMRNVSKGVSTYLQVFKTVPPRVALLNKKSNRD